MPRLKMGRKKGRRLGKSKRWMRRLSRMNKQ